MGVMDVMMDMMIKSISKEKREKMMINMMPLMMEGIDIYEFMPKMMTDMLSPTSCLFAISGIKYGHFPIVAHVISIGYGRILRV